MRRIREILRLCMELKLGQSKVAESLGISSSTVNRMMIKAEAAGLTWPLPADLDDIALEQLLYPPQPGRFKKRPEPDWIYIHNQLKQKGVTLSLLWQEYKEQHPDGFQLSHFCDLYRDWRKQLNPSMRQTHYAGQKAFSDFAGAKFRIIDRETGEVAFVSLFVSALGASNYTILKRCYHSIGSTNHATSLAHPGERKTDSYLASWCTSDTGANESESTSTTT